MIWRQKSKSGKDEKSHASRLSLCSWFTFGLTLLGLGLTFLIMSVVSTEDSWLMQASADERLLGSTIPIPPPEPPTPGSPTQTSTKVYLPRDELIYLNLRNIDLGPSTSTQINESNIVQSHNYAIRLEDDAHGNQVVTFPFSLTSDQEIRVFEADQNHITWASSSSASMSSNLKIILSSDLVGQTQGDLLIELGPLLSNGSRASAIVLGAKLTLGPLEFEQLGSKTGTIHLSADLHKLPMELALDVQGIVTDPMVRLNIDEAAVALGMGVAAVDSIVKVETNLVDEITSSKIEIGIDQSWAMEWTHEKIHIVSIGTGGIGRILDTTSLHEADSRQVSFIAESNEGFSTYALVALGQPSVIATNKDFDWILWLAIGLGSIASIGLATGVLLLKKLSKQRTND